VIDREGFRAAYCRVMHPGQHDAGPFEIGGLADAIADAYEAGLLEGCISKDCVARAWKNGRCMKHQEAVRITG
jgi:hypothetical protein